MYKIDFEKPIHIHFIGIGGISMSGLAEILLEEGFADWPKFSLRKDLQYPAQIQRNLRSPKSWNPKAHASLTDRKQRISLLI